MPDYQPGEKLDRQYGQTLEEIRPDHLKRYQFAAEIISPRSRVADVACGCGYGSWILHSYGMEVTGVDISSEAIEYGRRHYQGPTYIQSKAQDFSGDFDALVTFETLEHIADPEIVLKGVRSPLVIASVPNETLYPFKAFRFGKDKYPHLRHYTPEEFEDLLVSAGLEVVGRYCQPGKRSVDVVEGINGRFLIYVAKR